jgi:tetratricopeptide (TPR) repeat protein
VSPELLPVLEAAAIVRWFDRSILRSVTKLKDVSAAYEELRRFPFVKSSKEGLRFHDSVRDIMDASLRVDDSDRYKELHKRAATHFQKQLDLLFAIPGLSDEWQRLALEVSYHLNLSNESKGIDFLHKSFGQGLAYFRYQFCGQLIIDGESMKLSSARSLHRLRFDKIRLTIAEFSPAYVTKEEFDEVVAKSDVDPTTKWEVFFDYANFLGFIAKPDEQANYFRQSLDALKSAGMEETAAGCIIISAVASTYFDEPSKRIQLNKRAIDISKRIGEPFIAYNPYVELGHVYLDIGDYLKAEKSWRAALDIAEKYSNDARIADAFNRVAHALMATGRLLEAEEVLNSALTAAKRLPDTLGAGRDKEMYIKRHLGMLYQMRGEYDKAIQYYSESVQIYRERRSTGGRLRTLVLLAGCLFEVGRHQDVGSLAQEIEQCAAQLRISEMVAGWQAIEGHLLISDSIDGRTGIVDDAIAKYGEALKTALRAHTPVVYEIINRIFWRLDLLTKTETEQDVIRVLQGLVEYWKGSRIEGRSLLEVETEKRQKFTRGREKISIEPPVLTQFETALTQGLPKRKPAPWLAY